MVVPSLFRVLTNAIGRGIYETPPGQLQAQNKKKKAKKKKYKNRTISEVSRRYTSWVFVAAGSKEASQERENLIYLFFFDFIYLSVY
jgi:hypothetical protein